MSNPPLLLVAASGLAREAASAARSSGRQVLGVLDDRRELVGREVAPRLPVLGTVDDAVSFPQAELLLCAGKGATRSRIADRLRALGVGPERYATVVEPSVVVGSHSVVGAGSILLAGTVLTADVTVGEHVVCMPHVVLTHDCRLESWSTVCAGVVLGGSVVVGSRAYVGMAASVRENLTVGTDCTIGMGAVVLADVPDGQTWVGVPARPVAPSPV